MVLQSETAECGLACLAMVAGFYGRRLSLHEMRARFALSRRGASLKFLLKIAEGLDFAARPVRLELDELRTLQGPALLHWDLDHFVVLRKFDFRGRAIIHNPALGVRRYALEEVSAHFTGVAVELTPKSDFRPAARRPGIGLKSLVSGHQGLGWALAQILLLSVLLQCFALAAPFYLQLVVDDVLVRYSTHLLAVLALGFGLLLVVRVITRALRDRIVQHAAAGLGIGMSAELFAHLLRLPTDYFAARRIGDVTSRFESLKPIQAFFSGGAIGACVDGALAVTTLGMMLFYSTLLSSIVVISFLLYLAARLATFVALRARSDESISAAAAVDSQFVETLQAITGIKAAGRENELGGIWVNRFVASKSADLKVGNLQIGFDAAHGLISGLENVLVVFVGAHLVMDGRLTIGMLYAFVAFKNHFVTASSAFVDEALRYRMLGLHLERVADIAESEAESGLQVQSGFSVRPQGELELHRVWYRYSEGEPWVLEDFSLRMRPGQKICLQGPSGCGKSTVLKLAAGLLRPQRGEVRLGGRPVAGALLHHFRQSSALVTDTDVLLSGSIVQNVTFFDLEPDYEAVERACRLADIHEDIVAMPMAYDTRVGALGSVMSAGQLQRLLLARALYRRPWLLILDEATAHLDRLTESRIFTNIAPGLSGEPLTCLLASHSEYLPAAIGASVVRLGRL